MPEARVRSGSCAVHPCRPFRQSLSLPRIQAHVAPCSLSLAALLNPSTSDFARATQARSRQSRASRFSRFLYSIPSDASAKRALALRPSFTPVPPAMAGAPDLPSRLLRWYDRHARVLPWRALPGETADPYRVWLSEIMLQQTTVATVRGYFTRFVERWPTVEALAAASLDDVLHGWAGLGYYARARNLHACAGAVVARHGGSFPRSEEALLSLPGIGTYTAAAITAIAFDQQAAAVDGNVERVIARFYAVETPLPAAKPRLRALAQELAPAERAGDYAQAMMDLGATICTPRQPQCLLCPWSSDCRALAIGLTQSLPAKTAKAAKPARYGTVFWVQDAVGRVLLRRRPEKGLLGGLMEVPSTPWTDAPPSMPALLADAPVLAAWQPLEGTVRHVFTHFTLDLSVMDGTFAGLEAPVADGEIWVPLSELDDHALPTLMRKVVAHALVGGSGRLKTEQQTTAQSA